MTFYLIDVSNSGSPFLLATVTPVVKTVAPSFTITNPIYAPYSVLGLYGSATLTWNSPLTPNIEIHVDSPTGPLLIADGTSGTAQASNWVTNGQVFYLVDANTHVVLNKVTASVQLQPDTAYLLIGQNPIQNPAGQLGSATLNWSAPDASVVEVHVGAPDGPLLERTGPQGTGTAPGWVEDGMIFYLQDVSSGQPLTSQHTISTQTAHFVQTTPRASFQATPNPIPIAPGGQFGSTTLFWTARSPVTAVEVHIGSPSGPTMVRGSAIGRAVAPGWVADGTVFYLQDVSNQHPLTPQNTLGTVTAHLQVVTSTQ
jgi:hypothetical protein